jgi:hypothetical protein
MPPTKSELPIAAGADRTTPDSIVSVILAGAFGGALVPLLRISLAFTNQSLERPPEIGVAFWLAVVLLALLGAGVAWGFKETQTPKAIVLGLSLPSFLQIAVSDVSQKTVRHSERTAILPSIVSIAFAQAETRLDRSSVKLVPARSIEIATTNSTGYSAILFDSSGKQRATFKVLDERTFSSPIPDDAASIQFQAGESTSPHYSLSTNIGSATRFDLEVARAKQYGWWQAFGAVPTTKADISAKSREVKPPRPGAEGWVYLGTRNGDSWDTPYLAIQGNMAPTTGALSVVAFPTKLRPEPGSEGFSSGAIRAGSKLNILGFKSEDGTNYWAKVRTESSTAGR